jgi:hypothetical protein
MWRSAEDGQAATWDPSSTATARRRSGARPTTKIAENAQDHAKSKHSMTVTREQALALAERE